MQTSLFILYEAVPFISHLILSPLAPIHYSWFLEMTEILKKFSGFLNCAQKYKTVYKIQTLGNWFGPNVLIYVNYSLTNINICVYISVFIYMVIIFKISRQYLNWPLKKLFIFIN